MEKKLFEIYPTGDPYNETGWDVREYENSYEDRFSTFRGDLSPIPGRSNAIRTLERLYPGCEVRVSHS